MKTVRCDQWRETLISFVYGECESVEQERLNLTWSHVSSVGPKWAHSDRCKVR